MAKLTFKGIACPEPKTFSRDWSKVEKLTVPDQSLSLQEILERFTRKEALPIGHNGSYNDEIDIDSPFAVDLEKLEKADLIEKAEYAEQWRSIADQYKKEDEARRKAKFKADVKKRADQEEERIKAEVEKRVSAKGTSVPPAV